MIKPSDLTTEQLKEFILTDESTNIDLRNRYFDLLCLRLGGLENFNTWLNSCK